MNDLLYLVHRIPYPPNKGDKIRSFNILKSLSKNYRVHLGAFIDSAGDWQYAEELKEYCSETCLVNLHAASATLSSARGLLSGSPLTLPYYHSTQMKKWVADVVPRAGIRRAFVFSSSMAQYLDNSKYSSMRRVLDFVDVDSDKWRQYSKKKSWPMSWVYRREGNCLESVERRFSNIFDASVFVSSSEAELFRSLCPDSSARTHFMNNGVDSDYFSPAHRLDSPYSSGAKVLVFTGAMDYWANAESVSWFARDIFPEVRKRDQAAEFYIVGSNPSKAVLQLEQHEGVYVTGAVPDVRPYIKHAVASVAPLRIARGVQNKVLEAMAMAKPVLVSPAAIEGIDYSRHFEKLLCRSEEDFVTKSIELFGELETQEFGQALRAHVVANYSWEHSLGKLIELLEGNE